MKQLLQKAAILGSTLLLGATLMSPAALAAPNTNNCTGTSDPSTSSCFNATDVGTNDGNAIKLTSVYGFANLSQAINTIVTAVIFFAAIVAFVFIVIGAFRYVSAGDDAAGTKAARTIITNAVVGLILVALVYVIFQIVIRTVPGLKDLFTTS